VEWAQLESSLETFNLCRSTSNTAGEFQTATLLPAAHCSPLVAASGLTLLHPCLQQELNSLTAGHPTVSHGTSLGEALDTTTAAPAVNDNDITWMPLETVHVWSQTANNGDVNALVSLLKLQAVLSSAVHACSCPFCSVPFHSPHFFFADSQLSSSSTTTADGSPVSTTSTLLSPVAYIVTATKTTAPDE